MDHDSTSAEGLEAASKLPEEEQDALAALILEEVDSDNVWDESFR